MLIFDALNAVYSFLRTHYRESDLKIIRKELDTIARANDYVYVGEDCSVSYSYIDIQRLLSKMNEKESIRKSKGVYYTPGDVIRFILRNSFMALFSKLSPENIGQNDLPNISSKAFCMQKTVFDPTCGAGEFLLEALNMKFDMLDMGYKKVTRPMVHNTVATIRGNDVNTESVAIAKIRLFLCVLSRYGVRSIVGLSNILNQCFTTIDYVACDNRNEKYDMIVGNPPYVEDSKSGLNLTNKFGNIYANVLLNAANQLAPHGSLGFVVPLSYISTPRMKKLRKELIQRVPEQYILSYADRPDCLFDSVHQKLCIIIGKASVSEVRTYTGNYQFWYNSERAELFSKTMVVENKFGNDSFIPKLGTVTDIDIYTKITNAKTLNSVYEKSRQGTESVYLNRREAFWMKAYRTLREDPEYKVFSYKTAAEADYCYCLINSSLFWWYWICTSDCWHVSKELNGFMAPNPPAGNRATELANNLRDKLEATKVFVGTAQTEYEYKHKECMDEIHAIDDFVNRLFGLTEEESTYIKNFAFKYRTSGGA